MLCDAYMTGSVEGSWSGAAGTEMDETSVRGRPSPGVQRCLGSNSGQKEKKSRRSPQSVSEANLG